MPFARLLSVMRPNDLLKIEDAQAIVWISRQSGGKAKRVHYLTVVRKSDGTRFRTRITQDQAQANIGSIMLHIELLLAERGRRSEGAMDIHEGRDTHD